MSLAYSGVIFFMWCIVLLSPNLTKSYKRIVLLLPLVSLFIILLGQFIEMFAFSSNNEEFLVKIKTYIGWETFHRYGLCISSLMLGTILPLIVSLIYKVFKK